MTSGGNFASDTVKTWLLTELDTVSVKSSRCFQIVIARIVLRLKKVMRNGATIIEKRMTKKYATSFCVQKMFYNLS